MRRTVVAILLLLPQLLEAQSPPRIEIGNGEQLQAHMDIYLKWVANPGRLFSEEEMRKVHTLAGFVEGVTNSVSAMSWYGHPTLFSLPEAIETPELVLIIAEHNKEHPYAFPKYADPGAIVMNALLKKYPNPEKAKVVEAVVKESGKTAKLSKNEVLLEAVKRLFAENPGWLRDEYTTTIIKPEDGGWLVTFRPTKTRGPDEVVYVWLSDEGKIVDVINGA